MLAAHYWKLSLSISSLIMYGNGILSFKCMLFRGKASAVLIKAEKRDIEFIVHREAREKRWCLLLMSIV